MKQDYRIPTKIKLRLRTDTWMITRTNNKKQEIEDKKSDKKDDYPRIAD